MKYNHTAHYLNFYQYADFRRFYNEEISVDQLECRTLASWLTSSIYEKPFHTCLVVGSDQHTVWIFWCLYILYTDDSCSNNWIFNQKKNNFFYGQKLSFSHLDFSRKNYSSLSFLWCLETFSRTKIKSTPHKTKSLEKKRYQKTSPKNSVPHRIDRIAIFYWLSSNIWCRTKLILLEVKEQKIEYAKNHFRVVQYVFLSIQEAESRFQY